MLKKNLVPTTKPRKRVASEKKKTVTYYSFSWFHLFLLSAIDFFFPLNWCLHSLRFGFVDLTWFSLGSWQEPTCPESFRLHETVIGCISQCHLSSLNPAATPSWHFSNQRRERGGSISALNGHESSASVIHRNTYLCSSSNVYKPA